MARRFWIRLLDMETKGVHTINPMAKKLYYDSIDVEIIRRLNAIDLEKKVSVIGEGGYNTGLLGLYNTRDWKIWGWRNDHYNTRNFKILNIRTDWWYSGHFA